MSRGLEAYRYSLECLDTVVMPEGNNAEPFDIIRLVVRSVYTLAGGSNAHLPK